MIDTKFVKAILRFALSITILMAAVLLFAGLMLIFYPGTVIKILIYAVGGICIAGGLALVAGLLRGVLAR